jgi:hypothetical protein
VNPNAFKGLAIVNAANYGNTDTFKVLLLHGADPHLKGGGSRSAEEIVNYSYNSSMKHMLRNMKEGKKYEHL